MLILSNALTNVVDEGCVKVANSLVKRIKKADKNTHIVTFDRHSSLSNEHLQLNKLLLNWSLIRRLRKHREVLYIPFPAKTFSIAMRIFVLSLFSRKHFRVMLSMTNGIDFKSKLLLKLSGAKLVVFSKRSYDLYRAVVGERRVTYLKAGVDTTRFIPVDREKAKKLKESYGFDPVKKLVLHVGHLNKGRNVQQLMKLTDQYEVLLVSSTQTKGEQDLALKEELLSRGVRVIDSYIPKIEEIYQMADVYFFPVVELGRCIDVPLSCMEAAACNKPIITTDFGEMREFIGKDGFYKVESFEKESLEYMLEQALSVKEPDTRNEVLEYDWSIAAQSMMEG